MSQITQSFDRIAVLSIYETQQVPGPNGVNVVPVLTSQTDFRSKQDDGTPGFRIRFSVKKVNTGINNSTTIQIYNLGKESRAKFQKPGNKVELFAGYANLPKRIFTGNVSWGRTQKIGPDYVTSVDCIDGIVQEQGSRVDMSFKQSLSASQAIQTLTGILQGNGLSIAEVSGVPSSIYNQGLVMSGKTMDVLRQICDNNDLICTIQNGELVIIPRAQARKLLPTIVVSSGDETTGLPNTGLVGIPEQKNKANLSFKVLLNPNMEIHQQIIMKSSFVFGLYLSANVTHSGDTFSNEWYTDVEALKIGNLDSGGSF